MNRSVQKDRIRDGAVITFLAAILIAVLAFQVCLNTKPGQFLPQELTQRENVTSVYIIQGIEDASAKAFAIRDSLSGNGKMTAGECWTAFANDNFDPFFLLAVMIPGAGRFLLELGLYLKFGLAAAFMYYFCCRHVELDRKMSVILGLAYAFSSQVILLAQFSAVMNMVVMLPVVLSSYDSFLRKRTGRSFAASSLAAALFMASGTCADIVGIPFLVLSSLVMCIALYDGARTILTSWARLLVTDLLGFLLAGFVLFPRFMSLEPSFDPETAFEKASVDYTVFDILTGNRLMQSGGITNESAPLCYMGILTVTALVLFAANRKIPFKLKIAVFAVTALTFISCGYSFVREMFTLYEVTPVITECRIICLSALLIFIAALSIKNASGLKNGVYYASCAIPCAFIMLANIKSFDGKSSGMSLLITIIAYIVCACAVKYQADGGSGHRLKVFTVLASFAILCNTAFIIANNSIKAAAVYDPYGSREQADGNSLSCEEGFTLSVFTDSDSIRYLVASSDLSQNGGNMEFVQAVNSASGSCLIGNVFEAEDSSMFDARNLTADGMNRYTIGTGYCETSFSVGSLNANECYIYCGFDCPASVGYRLDGMETKTEFGGPFLCPVGGGDSIGSVKVTFNSSEEMTDVITFLRLDREALSALNDVTRTADSLKFSFEYADIPGDQGGIKSVVFSIPYSDDYTVKFNGNEAKTFEYGGRLAAVFSGSENVPRYDVVIGKKVPGLGGGIAVSVVIGVFLVALTVRGGYNKKASSDGGKAGTDAQQEDN